MVIVVVFAFNPRSLRRVVGFWFPETSLTRYIDMIVCAMMTAARRASSSELH